MATNIVANRTSSTCIPFPKAMERGRKVCRGPLATLVTLPQPVRGDELLREWGWLKDNAKDWGNEDVVGDVDLERVRRSAELSRAVAEVRGVAFDDCSMRRDIAAWRLRVQTRAQVKDWLEALGVDWGAAKTPEDALFFVFRCLRSPGGPTCA
ncbi:MAG TPA: hypothetical protein VIT62_06590 [Lysobacter sp.]